ncbi:MAG: efflux RND transporter periplasmic adaptor subunit [Psychrobium sp.]|nr:efflux RND transporter periplasmic adaptor subunit [Psychrobium sp.]
MTYLQQSATAAYERAKLDVKDSQASAPTAGFIAKKIVKQGHFTQGFQQLFHIVDQTQLQAVVYLPEHQLSNVRLKQQAFLKFYALSEQTFQASVRSIAPIIDRNSGTFKVILSLSNDKLLLKPGMFAQISLVFDTHDNALTVPSDAIIKRDGHSYIFVVRDNKAQEIAIETGFRQETMTEISGDIKSGDLIVVNGQRHLKNEALVNVLNANPSIATEEKPSNTLASAQ